MDPEGETTPPQGVPNSNSEGGQDKSSPHTSSLLLNRLSVAGLFVSGFALANIFFLLVFGFLSAPQNQYLGIFAYLVFPGILFLGLVLVSAGALFTWWRQRKLGRPPLPWYPQIDLSSPRAWTKLVYLGGMAATVLFLSVTASYQTYRFTDTVTFCGSVCHAVMKPEFTAYQDSPHAHVPCVDCHVGPTATWYVRSKLSGGYQVYAVASHQYPKPIETPITNLRPVREACEKCHWPIFFYGEQLREFTHVANDRQNTITRIRMLIKTGGGSPELGQAAGIHYWHLTNKVWFRAGDTQHQIIPWVKAESPQGVIKTYSVQDSGLSARQIEALPLDEMDCVSCHSRPAHRFEPPDQAVDDAFAAGTLDPGLPYLKAQAVTVLTTPYSSTEEATEGIATSLDSYYRICYRGLYAQHMARVAQAIATLQDIYRRNIFPHMKTDWRPHPDNLGHLYYGGCFRCHDGQHVSSDNTVIKNDCNTCHTVESQTYSLPGATPEVPGKFQHPVDLSSMAGIGCNTCHTGGAL